MSLILKGVMYIVAQHDRLCFLQGTSYTSCLCAIFCPLQWDWPRVIASRVESCPGVRNEDQGNNLYHR